MTLSTFVGNIIGLINTAIPVLIGIALILFFIGIIRYIYETGDSRGHTEGKELILWGLVALFILVSVWGILALMRQALNL